MWWYALNAEKYFLILALLIFPGEFFLLPSMDGWITLWKYYSKAWTHSCGPPALFLLIVFLIMPQTLSTILESLMISCLAKFFPSMWLIGQRLPLLCFFARILFFLNQHYSGFYNSSLGWSMCYQALRIFLSFLNIILHEYFFNFHSALGL